MARAKSLLPRRPYLQVAIDLTDAAEALKLAKTVALSDNVIIEAGTPLIKKEGIRIVRLISAVIGGKPVLADMKTMDTGYLEAKMAFSEGALITTVLGVSDDSTITGAVKAARESGGLVQVDMLNVRNPIHRAIEAVEIGADIIGLHAGIDQQGGGRRATDLLPLIGELKKQINEAYISVAGGIRPGDVEKFLMAGADIIVMGSSITSSLRPEKVVKNILERMRAKASL